MFADLTRKEHAFLLVFGLLWTAANGLGAFKVFEAFLLGLLLVRSTSM